MRRHWLSRWIVITFLLAALAAVSGCGTLEVGIEKPATADPAAAASETAMAATTSTRTASTTPVPSATRITQSPNLPVEPSPTDTAEPVSPSATATARPALPSATSSATISSPSATPPATETATTAVPAATATPPSTPLPTPTLVVEHWRGEYYDTMGLSGTPVLVRDDTDIDFYWGTESPIPGRLGVDQFSVRWSRQLNPPAGTYRFTMTVDDGARLYVGGHLLIDVWRDQHVRTYTGDIFLAGGPVAVTMEYYENREVAVAELTWEPIPLTPSSDTWQTYWNPIFAVSLRHPVGWQTVPGYGEPEAGGKVAGEDGYFLLNAMGDPGGSIDEAAAAEAHHIMQPYGSQPVIESLQIAGQEARLILPSADASMPDQAALIVRYPQPVTISGHVTQFFVLYADVGHVRRIGETVRFQAQPGGS